MASVGGVGANLAADYIVSKKVIDHHDDGMEAVFEIEVKNLPAYIVIDDKGGDLYSQWAG